MGILKRHSDGQAFPTEKRGIKSDSMHEHGSDVIDYKMDDEPEGMKGNREPWKMLSESKRRELIPRIWNETLTKEQRIAAIDNIIKEKGYGYKNDHWYDVVHKSERNNFDKLPAQLQKDLLEHYKYRTTLDYNGNVVFDTSADKFYSKQDLIQESYDIFIKDHSKKEALELAKQFVNDNAIPEKEYEEWLTKNI